MWLYIWSYLLLNLIKVSKNLEYAPFFLRANLRESMKSLSRVNTFKRTSTTRQTRTHKKPSNGVEKSFGDNDGCTGLIPPPTADSVLSRASSRNNVNEFESNQQELLQAQADQKIHPASHSPTNVCTGTLTISNNAVKVDNVSCGNLETVYEDKTDAVCSEHESSA